MDELTAYFRAVTMHDSGAATAVPVAPVDHDEPAMGEEACTLRVRRPDGCAIRAAGEADSASSGEGRPQYRRAT